MKNTSTTFNPSTLCKALLNNAQFTTASHFIGKSIGENIYSDWKKAITELKHNSFNYYVALADEVPEIEEYKNKVYTSIKNLLALVGEIPTSDGKSKSKINSSVLFADSVALAVKIDSKVEVTSVINARQALRTAKTEYKNNCLTKDGKPKKGLTEEYVKGFTDTIDKAQKKLDDLLAVANYSVYGTKEQSFATFAKKFEIQLRKAMLKQYNFTAKEAKAEKDKLNQTRKENRGGDKK